MAWQTPFDRSRVNKAGDVLIADFVLMNDYDEALEIVNNWRTSHGYPLQCLKMTLKKRARKLDPNALVAQRIKRIPAIKLKLKTSP